MKKFTLFLGFLCFTFMAAAQIPAAITIEPADAGAYDELTLILDVTQSCPDGALLDVDQVMIHSGVTVANPDSTWKFAVPYDGMGVNGQEPRLWPVIDSMPAAVTIMPPDATAWDTLTLFFDAKKACPADALLDADSVMLHSGVNIDGAAWQNVVDFDAMGADGQQPKLTHVGNDVWSITYCPATFYDIPEGSVVTEINCVFNNGTWDAEGKDFGENEDCIDFNIPLENMDITEWQFTYVPADYYGLEAGMDIIALNAVFNNGSWDAEGKDYDEDNNCIDFYIPFTQTSIYEIRINEVALHPNPVKNILYIENLRDVNLIEIFSVTGELVDTFDNISSETYEINTSDFEPGIYILSVRGNKVKQISRFIKQ